MASGLGNGEWEAASGKDGMKEEVGQSRLLRATESEGVAGEGSYLSSFSDSSFFFNMEMQLKTEGKEQPKGRSW